MSSYIAGMSTSILCSTSEAPTRTMSSMNVINEVPDNPIDKSLDAQPSLDEVWEALAKLRSCQAGILPKMWKLQSRGIATLS